MRVCKISREMIGLETYESCICYFQNVLPTVRYRLPLIGTPFNVMASKSSYEHDDRILLFVYEGRLLGIALLERKEVLEDEVVALHLVQDSVHIFKQFITVRELEAHLRKCDRPIVINGTRGWNILAGDTEKFVLEFLMAKQVEMFKRDQPPLKISVQTKNKKRRQKKQLVDA